MIAQNVAEIISRHVKLTVEGIDRMYLNVFVAGLAVRAGNRPVLPHASWSAATVCGADEPDDAKLCGEAGRLVAGHDIPLVQFEKGQRKDAVMAEHLRRFAHEEGWCSSASAGEHSGVPHRAASQPADQRRPYPWIVRRSAMVNNYYIYAVDSRLRAILPQVLQLLSVQRQACA